MDRIIFLQHNKDEEAIIEVIIEHEVEEIKKIIQWIIIKIKIRDITRIIIIIEIIDRIIMVNMKAIMEDNNRIIIINLKIISIVIEINIIEEKGIISI